MGATAQVRDNDIIAAGQRLLDQGRNVTGWALRREIGSGRPERLLEVWQSSNNNPASETSAGNADAHAPLPGRLIDHQTAVQARMIADLDGIMLGTWRVAEEIAESRTREEREAARTIIERCESELADAAAACEAADANAEAQAA